MRLFSFVLVVAILSGCGPDCEKTCNRMAETMGKDQPNFDQAKSSVIASCMNDCKAGGISKERAVCYEQAKNLGELGLCDKTIK